MKKTSLADLFITTISLFLLTFAAVAQNQVLDGEGDYVRLPDDMFNNLDAATSVERRTNSG